MAVELRVRLENGQTYSYLKLQYVRLDGRNMDTVTANYKAYRDKAWFEGGGLTDAQFNVELEGVSILELPSEPAGVLEERVDDAFVASNQEVEVRGGTADTGEGRRVR